jgi:hypothetical protein
VTPRQLHGLAAARSAATLIVQPPLLHVAGTLALFLIGAAPFGILAAGLVILPALEIELAHFAFLLHAADFRIGAIPFARLLRSGRQGDGDQQYAKGEADHDSTLPCHCGEIMPVF